MTGHRKKVAVTLRDVLLMIKGVIISGIKREASPETAPMAGRLCTADTSQETPNTRAANMAGSQTISLTLPLPNMSVSITCVGVEDVAR